MKNTHTAGEHADPADSSDPINPSDRGKYVLLPDYRPDVEAAANRVRQDAEEGRNAPHARDPALQSVSQGIRRDLLGSVKMNVFASPDANVRAVIGSAALDEYKSFPSLFRALRKVHGDIDAHFDGDERNVLTVMLEDLMKNYINAHQYHNAEHALKMTHDAFEMAKLMGLQKGMDLPLARRILFTGMYHDVGNSSAPDKPGGDELAAVKKFLEDVALANVGRKFPSLVLQEEDVLQVAGSILGTVFPDRFATKEQLMDLTKYKNAFVKNAVIQHPDYVTEGLKLLHDAGYKDLTKEQLVNAMLNGEALAVKNADILSSLRVESLVKNGIGNAQEDLKRLNSPFLGQGAQQYRNGFLAFLAGKFHGAWFAPIDGSATTINEEFQTQADKEGSPLLVPAGTAPVVRERVQAEAWRLMGEAKNAYNAFVQHDGALLNALQACMTRMVDVQGQQAPSFMGLRLRDVPQMLRDTLKNRDEIKQGLRAWKDGSDADIDAVDALVNRDGLDAYFAPEALGDLADRTISSLDGPEATRIFCRKALAQDPALAQTLMA
ncbi:MAG: hypothetical protein Greene041619_954 [Candidatus Peregrinibacteria bacterium Greene0416_19]|nr:MAG: hypothetical protein Greene041619_954 [Candidatus Peregrinibacteria bacterium Greene0416_19]